ncbi:MAG: HdeD family acid-resistance protein [Sedimentisphaerales bacterium]|nr:HdeD family acid-resistance protein [Sedimentisphaerales bacterium]
MKDFTQIQQIDPLPGLHDSKLKIWRWLLGTGVIVILLGLAAIFLPFVATLAIEILIAMILLTAGVTQVVHAFKSQKPKGFTFRLLAAGLYGFAGILLLVFPLHGALTLTLLLAVFFAIIGAFKIALALHIRPYPSWDWLLISGLIAVVLGALIWMGLPGTATWAIGLLVGIELLFSGGSMIRFALSVRDESERSSSA